jgi:type IV pilus assembly protein PilN
MTSPARIHGKAQGSLVLDLLRERRRSLGIEALSPTLAQRRALLQRGALIGLSLLGSMLGLWTVLLFQSAMVRNQLGQLEQFEGQAAELQAKIDARNQKLAAIKNTNQELAQALTSGRTSSALLTALQLNTPVGVQLLSVDTTNDLLIKGQAFDPLALVRINAFQLQIQNLAFFDPKAVQLTKVERQPSAVPATPRSGNGPAPAPEAGPLAFELRAPFATLDAQKQLALLQQLGSDGMARRLNLLRSEGLMP